MKLENRRCLAQAEHNWSIPAKALSNLTARINDSKFQIICTFKPNIGKFYHTNISVTSKFDHTNTDFCQSGKNDKRP